MLIGGGVYRPCWGDFSALSLFSPDMEILYAMRPLRLRHRCQLGLAVQRLSVFNHFDRNGGLSHPAVFLLLIGAVVYRKALSLGKMLWIFLAFIGVILTVDLTGDHFSLSSSHTIGLVFALGAALLYAAVTMISKRLKKIGPYFVAFLQLSVGAMLLSPFMDHVQFDNITALQWRYLILIGAIHTCFKYMLMYSAWQKLKTPMIAVMAFIYPAIAIPVDYLAYGQVLSITQSIGIGLIVIVGYAVSMNHPFPFTPKKKIRLRKKKKNPQKA